MVCDGSHQILPRHFSHDDFAAIQDIFEDVDRSTSHLVLPAFKAPKSDNTSARFVINAVETNAAQRRIGSLLTEPMPRLPSFLSLKRFNWGWTADAKNWFHQLLMPSALRKFFCVKFVIRRGSYRLVQPTRVPMGATSAPAFAQRAARAILREVRRR